MKACVFTTVASISLHAGENFEVSPVMVERIAAAYTAGGDTAGLTDVAKLLGANRLPSASLTEGSV